MTIEQFLAGLAPAPEPEPWAPRWRVEQRHAEGGEWALRAEPAEQGPARDEAADPGPAALGDLVRLLDPFGRTQGFWVRGPTALHDAGPVPHPLGDHGRDWVAAWEGEGTAATSLILAAWTLDVRRLALAVADGLAGVAPGRSRDPGATARAVETARRWALGRDAPGEVDAAWRSADADREALTRLRARAGAPDWAFSARQVAEATAKMLVLALGVRAGATPWHVAWEALDALRADADDAEDRALAARVRRWASLPAALLAREDLPTPPSLGF